MMSLCLMVFSSRLSLIALSNCSLGLSFLDSLFITISSDFICESIVTCKRDEHSRKASLSIDFTEEGINIYFNDSHFIKDEFPIETIDD